MRQSGYPLCSELLQLYLCLYRGKKGSALDDYRMLDGVADARQLSQVFGLR